jgi:hypothetical protein
VAESSLKPSPVAGCAEEAHASGAETFTVAVISDAEPAPKATSSKPLGGMLRKARTCVIDKAEVDIMVTQFLCHDDTVRSHIGKGSKQS